MKNKLCLDCVYWQEWVCLIQRKQIAGCTPACESFLSINAISFGEAVDIRIKLKTEGADSQC